MISFFSGCVVAGVIGVSMTVWKYCIIKGHDTVKIVYNIRVKLDVQNGFLCEDLFLNDVIEYDIKTEDVLKKIPELEEQVKKREEELKEKATKLSEVLNKLLLLGYTVTVEGSIGREPIIRENRCPPY